MSFSPFKIFGPIGKRTEKIIATIGAILLVVRPVLNGEGPAPLDTISVPAAIAAIDWIVKFLAFGGLITGAAKVSRIANK